jgi:hypothetical protein
MQGVVVRTVSLGLAAILVTAATVGSKALFEAPSSGADLQPVGGAEQIIELLQGQQSILWSSVGGNVSSLAVTGWPSQSQDGELGGALVIQRPADGGAGVIAFGEKPMSLRFDLGG